MYDSYLLSQIKDKINVRRNSDIVSISAFQTSCLQAHQKTNLDINKRHNIMNILSNIRIYKCLK